MNSPPWMPVAIAGIGQREIPGPAENSWIVALWKKIKRGGIKSERVPWCSAFVGACMEDVGIESTRFESAASWEKWGQPLTTPVYGCVVVFSRDGGGHVGFVSGVDDAGNLLVLGGNQGDAVSIAAFSPSRVRAFRWPVSLTAPQWSPLPVASAAMSLKEA